MSRLIMISSLAALVSAVLGVVGMALSAPDLARLGFACCLIMLYASLQARLAQDS